MELALPARQLREVSARLQNDPSTTEIRAVKTASGMVRAQVTNGAGQVYRTEWKRPSKTGTLLKHQAGGMAKFGAAHLLKGAVQGRFGEAAAEMKSPGFIGGMMMFPALQGAVNKGTHPWAPKSTFGRLSKGATRFALPIYAGITIMHVMNGQSTPLDAMADATSFATVALAMMPLQNVLRMSLYPTMLAAGLAAGPVGVAAALVGMAAIEVAQLAVLLIGSEALTPHVKKVLAPVADGLKGVGDGIVGGTKKTLSFLAEALRRRGTGP
jgi:hypothetical protein